MIHISRGEKGCEFSDKCIPAAYNIEFSRELINGSMAKITPDSPAALEAVSSPREAYLNNIALENNLPWIEEDNAWASQLAKETNGGCEGCPILSICVRIEDGSF